MGYDFKPKKKGVAWYQIGAFSWPMMLDAGLGLVLGTGKGFRAAEFIYIKRPDGLCVQYNDGASVSVRESKELAKVARWIAAVQTARLNQWETLPEAERQRMEADNEMSIYPKPYDLPWHKDAIKRFTDFADWAEKSGGFRIY
jgi:hypothetical protein